MALIEVNEQRVEGAPQWFETQTPPDWFAKGGIKSVQRGSVFMSNGSTKQITIANVDLSKSFLVVNTKEGHAFEDGQTSFQMSIGCWARLTTSSNIECGISSYYETQYDRVDNIGYGNVFWQVVEFY